MRALLALLVACTESTTTTYPECTLDEPTVAPASAAPGEQVVLTTSPLTEVWDTLVTVGGQRAELVEVARDNCDDCDSCVEDAGCSDCDVDACTACADTCDACVETVTFLVPQVAAGAQPVQVVNRHGASDLGTLVVLAVDTGGVDTGDTGPDTGDTGAVDTGGVDTGATDTGDTATDTAADTSADTATDTGTRGVDTGVSVDTGVDTGVSLDTGVDTGVSVDTADTAAP